MPKTLDLPSFIERLRTVELDDHFLEYVDADLWTKLAADASATVAHSPSTAAGAVVLTTAATDNNECSLRSTSAAFVLADRKPALMVARLSYTEANTDDANLMVGFSSSFAANAMIDDGAGPLASFSGAIIYKADGGTKWKCRTSLGTTYTDTASDQTAGGSQQLGVLIMPRSSTEVDVSFLCDPSGGGNLKTLVDTRGNSIKHTITLGSPANMYVGVYAKAGSANSEVITVDRISACQVLF